uniref:TMEM135_C_rich domain-containing protein n=1 Tax=Steinernema glaseri TaxID=37863 RepID=A0A1I8AQT4_9BILA
MATQKLPVEVDPLSIWERSAQLKEEESAVQKAIVRSSVAERFSGSRSQVWQTLSAMSAHDQAAFMSKLVVNWPYASERRALNFPLHGALLSTCVTASVVASKINSEFFLMNNRTPFFESIKQCPKSPFVFGVYTAGISLYVLHQTFITKQLYAEERPCSSCVLTQNVVNGLTAGIAVPLLSLPYLSYYILLQRKNENFPKVSSYIEFLTLSWEGIKACRRVLPYLIGFHVLAGSIGAYSMLWGRNRIFDTLDVDADAASRALRTASETTPFRQKIDKLLKKLPLYGRLINGDDDDL